MNDSERIVAIGGQNRSNNVIKRRHHRVVENVYLCIPNTVVPCDIYDLTKIVIPVLADSQD
jgi:predicted ABC-type ATPase